MSLEDHREYGDHSQGYAELYESALEAASKAPRRAIAVEVGIRAGGSALTLLNALKDVKRDQWLLTVDPHGDKPYLSRDLEVKGMYKDDLYRVAMKVLSDYAHEHQLDWANYKMKSLDWIEMFPFTEFWSDGEILKPEFFFVHLDGDHTDWVVRDEIAAFSPYMIPGGVICVDDADQITPDVVANGREYSLHHNRLWLQYT